jgi:phage terminase small subunit
MNEITKTDKDLTLKQRKWIKVYLECGNATEAAMQVYDVKNRDSANAIGSENLAKLSYQEFLEEAGITDNLIQKKIMEGLDATKVVSAVKTNREAGADSTDFIDVPDFMARHKYLETVLKLKKRMEDKENGSTGTNVTVVIGTGFVPPGTPIVATSVRYNAEEPAKIQSGSLA